MSLPLLVKLLSQIADSTSSRQDLPAKSGWQTLLAELLSCTWRFISDQPGAVGMIHSGVVTNVVKTCFTYQRGFKKFINLYTDTESGHVRFRLTPRVTVLRAVVVLGVADRFKPA